MSLNVYWIHQSLGIMPAPAGDELLPGEIQKLRDIGVQVLVSLLPREESASLGLERQDELCKESRIKLIRFAIKDFSVPVDIEAASIAVSMVSEALMNNQKTVVHCRGGIGRSSLFAGAVLVKNGESWNNAFEQIGRCRGCKVPETEQQAEWLKKFEELLKK